jgi:hypothetical protein
MQKINAKATNKSRSSSRMTTRKAKAKADPTG